jgi:alpha-D-xyloside xylohydrolase
MEGTLREGLSLGLSGFSFWSHDIGGFVTSTSEELYRRWLPMGFLSSHSRIHGAPPTEPWYYGKAFTDYFRKCAELKYSLMPYVYTQAVESAAHGWPMLRALLLEFPNDPGVWTVEDEYLYGSDILVAPMMEAGTSRNVYLPGEDSWIDYQTGKVYTPGWHNIACGDIQVVMLVRDGSAIPTVPVAQSTDRIQWDKLTWKDFSVNKKAAAHTVHLPQ